jgi:hypothetical protein
MSQTNYQNLSNIYKKPVNDAKKDSVRNEKINHQQHEEQKKAEIHHRDYILEKAKESTLVGLQQPNKEIEHASKSINQATEQINLK